MSKLTGNDARRVVAGLARIVAKDLSRKERILLGVVFALELAVLILGRRRERSGTARVTAETPNVEAADVDTHDC